MSRTLYGLLLAGGESRRMGRDKALLVYDGQRTQLERTSALLQSVCEAVFVSQRRTQSFPTPEGVGVIYDALDDIKGPLCGILSAMRAHPEADWLVVACDLPYLDTATLEKLVTAFHNNPPALTAYRSSDDGLPEPLCAIYPTGCDAALHQLALEIGRFSPRELLTLKEAALIDADTTTALDNINTTEAYDSLLSCKSRSSTSPASPN